MQVAILDMSLPIIGFMIGYVIWTHGLDYNNKFRLHEAKRSVPQIIICVLILSAVIVHGFQSHPTNNTIMTTTALTTTALALHHPDECYYTARGAWGPIVLTPNVNAIPSYIDARSVGIRSWTSDIEEIGMFWTLPVPGLYLVSTHVQCLYLATPHDGLVTWIRQFDDDTMQTWSRHLINKLVGFYGSTHGLMMIDRPNTRIGIAVTVTNYDGRQMVSNLNMTFSIALMTRF